MTRPEAAELVLNPVIARPDGAHVVPVRIKVATAAPPDPFRSQLRLLPAAKPDRDQRPRSLVWMPLVRTFQRAPAWRRDRGSEELNMSEQHGSSSESTARSRRRPRWPGQLDRPS